MAVEDTSPRNPQPAAGNPPARDPNRRARHPVARRKVNTLNTPPTFWGLRILQDVLRSRFRDIEERFQVFSSALHGSDPAKESKELTDVDKLIANDSGKTLWDTSAKHVYDIDAGSAYENHLFDLQSEVGQPWGQYVFDAFNNLWDDEETYGVNCMLREMTKLTCEKTKTWEVTNVDEFTVDRCTRVRKGFFPTAEIFQVYHLYVKWKGRIVDVLDWTRSWETDCKFDPPDKRSEYEKWKKMGNGKPSKMSENVLEPGINHVAALFEDAPDGSGIRPVEVYLDGDRMVLR